MDQLSSSYTLLKDTDSSAHMTTNTAGESNSSTNRQNGIQINFGRPQQDCVGDRIELKQVVTAGTLSTSEHSLTKNDSSGNAQRVTRSEADLQLQGSTDATQKIRQETDTETCLRQEGDSLSPLSSLDNSASNGGQTPTGILKQSQPLRENSCEESPTTLSSLLKNPSSLPITTLDNDDILRQDRKVSFASETSSSFPDGDEKGLLIQQGEKGDEPRFSKRQSRPPLQRLRSQLDLDDLSRNELELKANLYFHIGNPLKRWRVERVLPIKLLLQLLKTVCLIVQVSIFTQTVPHLRAQFFYNSRTVFESLFIKSFNEGNHEPRDVYTAFTIQDMYSQFEYITRQYYSLPDVTIGGYDYEYVDNEGNPSPVTMFLKRYRVAELHVINDSFALDGRINETLFFVQRGDNATQVYLENSKDPYFHSFVSLTVSFPIKNIRIVHPEKAECFLFNVSIFYENFKHGGKIKYYLRETHTKQQCVATVTTGTNNYYVTFGAITILDLMILVMCSLSICLTVNSLRRATKLAKAMGTFYQMELGIKLSWWERRSLFPFWHAINTISDLLILAGTIHKIFLDYQVNGLNDANPTRVLLGTAILFQAGVILRYVSYFKQLNALTRTIYLAFPELLKFLLCAFVLFIAFALTGWIVLGPFQNKFVDLNSSVESLFGLINGDDIYATFLELDPDDDLTAYIYSRFFLYIFLALFLYAVLNLFTSLVITAYETSQEFNNAYENEVRRFVFSGPLTPGGVALRDVTITKKYVEPEVIKLRLKSKKELQARMSSLSQSNRYKQSTSKNCSS